jgi:ammonium transporter, Amt family
VKPWAAILVGLIGTLFYCLSCRLFDKLKIDDPLESSQIHMFGGLWGLLAIGLFDMDHGIFFTGNFDIMLKQLIGAFAIMMWAVIVSFLYFFILKKVNKFRVGHIYEITGMDVLMHGGTDLLSNEMINKIEARQRSIANANRLQNEEMPLRNEERDGI